MDLRVLFLKFQMKMVHPLRLKVTAWRRAEAVPRLPRTFFSVSSCFVSFLIFWYMKKACVFTQAQNCFDLFNCYSFVVTLYIDDPIFFTGIDGIAGNLGVTAHRMLFGFYQRDYVCVEIVRGRKCSRTLITYIHPFCIPFFFPVSLFLYPNFLCFGRRRWSFDGRCAYHGFWS